MDAGVLVHCTDGYEDHHSQWKPQQGRQSMSASLLFAADAVPGFPLPLFTCKNGGVIFRPGQTQLLCGNACDSGGGCGGFTCPRATALGNLHDYDYPGDGCRGGSWSPPDFGMYLKRVSSWHKLNRRLTYNEIIVDAQHWLAHSARSVETFFRVQGQTAGFEAVEAMHAKFLRETGQSHEQAPLVTVDPRNWAAPFT